MLDFLYSNLIVKHKLYSQEIAIFRSQDITPIQLKNSVSLYLEYFFLTSKAYENLYKLEGEKMKGCSNVKQIKSEDQRHSKGWWN